MMKKNILAGLASACVIAASIGSFAFISDLQDQKLIGKVQVTENQKSREQTLTLAKKIGLSLTYDDFVQQSKTYNKQNPRGEDLDGKEMIGRVIDRELKKLDDLGMISMPIESVFCNMSWSWDYQINTYSNKLGEYAVMWDVQLKAEEWYFHVLIESETEKIIQMELTYKGVCPNADKGETWMEERWRTYLETDLKEEKDEFWRTMAEQKILYCFEKSDYECMVYPILNQNEMDEMIQK